MLRISSLILACAAALAVNSTASATTYDAIDLAGVTNITGIYDTVAGGNSTTAGVGGNTPGCYPEGEAPLYAIDGQTSTKYLAYGNFNTSGTGTPGGVNTGLYFTLNSTATVNTIRFATANDSSGRDPLTITLEGSNANSNDLGLGSSWHTLWSGVTGLAALSEVYGTYGDYETFSNTTAYQSYRILVTEVRSTTAGMTQFSEVQLFTAVPEPSTLLLLATGVAGLLAYAWRKRK